MQSTFHCFSLLPQQSKVVVLNEMMRVTDPEIQLNLRARSEKITEQDTQLLSTHITSETQLDVLWTYPTKAQRDARNARCLELHGTTVFVCALHAILGALFRTNSHKQRTKRNGCDC